MTSPETEPVGTNLDKVVSDWALLCDFVAYLQVKSLEGFYESMEELTDDPRGLHRFAFDTVNTVLYLQESTQSGVWRDQIADREYFEDHIAEWMTSSDSFLSSLTLNGIPAKQYLGILGVKNG